ncbi:hypothetical protein [Streptomyces cinereoruber]|uniref:hypothetical protein n=1 Tax=Streptomyces cinereoruber TaxID=67260 RepID=UPI00365EEA19
MTPDPPQKADAGYAGTHGPYVSFIDQLLSFGTDHVLQHDLLASPALTIPKGTPEIAERAAWRITDRVLPHCTALAIRRSSAPVPMPIPAASASWPRTR